MESECITSHYHIKTNARLMDLNLKEKHWSVFVDHTFHDRLYVKYIIKC